MNRLILLLVTMSLFFTACSAQEKAKAANEGINWLHNIEEAIEIAGEKNLSVFIHFTGSDWCIWCKRLESEVYQQQDFMEYAKENLVMVMLDFPRSIEQTEAVKSYNRKKATEYGIKGFPTVILLNSEGTKIAQTGYQQGGSVNYIQHLKTLLNN
ncbi:MAG: thioredoxin fold domain-containing protein [Candidatus Cloacimonetes bacterium]|nr:thioredoxin fold domain-containing protein [Candidatus Cloacimonadota bacterium]